MDLLPCREPQRTDGLRRARPRRFRNRSDRTRTACRDQYQDVFTDSDTAYLYAAGVLNAFDPQYQNAPTVEQVRQFKGNGPRNYIDATGYYLSDTMSVGDFVATAGIRFDDVTNAVENGATQKDDAASVSFGLLYLAQRASRPMRAMPKASSR